MATDDKYDRQLRLWGSHGQKLLMESHICCLGSSAVATETLKNLVLPGIGRFTVVDSAAVEAADLGNNFFLEEADLNKSRAEAVCRLLQELNPDVVGAFLNKSPMVAVQEGAEFFRNFTMVVACQLPEAACSSLGDICQQLNIPVIYITSLGFVGKIRLYISEHPVCETKPDSELGDLRLTDPFPELRQFANSIDLASLDNLRHGHVPYVVLLIKALDAWREQNSGKKLPKTKEEKDKLKEILNGWRRNPDELNFDEALDNAYKAWVPYTIPDPVQSLLELKTSNLKSDFWVVARAVSQFVRDCGKLPLAGSLPDMACLTEWYVKLQEIYSSRAGGDCAAINAHIAGIQREIGAEGGVSPDYVQRFCRNAQYAEVFRFRSLSEELQPPVNVEDGGPDWAEEIDDEESLIPWYFALRAAERYRQEREHFPGALAGNGEAALSADVAALTQLASSIVDSYKVENLAVESKYLEEIVRYGGCELHTTSSVLGGIAAQEAVKLISKQYSPLNNTLLYDGLHGKSQVLEF
eukprot:CAMPEP_0206541038 /NCGR_PEP_ID=MMETSP0325_2-20121206/9369_1 /ASSEMBLY_ACC=CAM_ASM_000347 /TAXON_ID=2866 /ORGANISM="Crypthecodinium cohnii, Strain Seligo" /LENGTH=524 /DNA_ID=CAMNT_0054038889 /DNA_START=519 /DNA_END=2093 /DNA_ORIENTATION=-